MRCFNMTKVSFLSVSCPLNCMKVKKPAGKYSCHSIVLSFKRQFVVILTRKNQLLCSGFWENMYC